MVGRVRPQGRAGRGLAALVALPPHLRHRVLDLLVDEGQLRLHRGADARGVLRLGVLEIERHLRTQGRVCTSRADARATGPRRTWTRAWTGTCHVALPAAEAPPAPPRAPSSRSAPRRCPARTGWRSPGSPPPAPPPPRGAPRRASSRASCLRHAPREQRCRRWVVRTERACARRARSRMRGGICGRGASGFGRALAVELGLLGEHLG